MIRPLLAAAAALAFASCSVLLDEAPPDDLQARADAVAAGVARIRDLSLEKSVPASRQSKHDLEEMVEAEIDDEWDDEGAGTERALKAFGLVPGDLDLKPFLREFYRENIAGYYDPEQDRFFVIEPDAPEAVEAAEEEGMEDEDEAELLHEDDLKEEFVLAHELTHAIDDQHFGLDEIREERDLDDDQDLAFSALVEGSAMEGGTEYMLDRIGLPLSTAGPLLSPIVGLLSRLPAGEVSELAEDVDDARAESLRRAPPIIRDSMTFRYAQGWAFTNRLRSEFGWTAVDGAYADPPESTEQILFPERYIDRRDRPVRVTLPPPPAGFTAIFDDTLGMFALRVLLGTRLDDEAVEVADAWDGDRYVVWETEAGDALGFVSVWDHEGGASDFEKTYRALLVARVGDDGTWDVTRRDDVVAVVQGAPRGSAEDAARHLLDGVDLERAPDDQAPDRWYWKVLRFPVALRPLDRVWEAHLLGGLALDTRVHGDGYRLSLLSRWALFAENNPDRSAFWAALGLVGFTRDRTIDSTFARVPFAFSWHGRGGGEERRARWTLGPFGFVEYENLRGTKEFDLVWGWLTRVRWGDESRDGKRLRILFVPIPGI